MIKEREPALERISVLLQVAVTLVCFYMAIIISHVFIAQTVIHSKEHIVITLLIGAIWHVLLELFDLGAMSRIQRYRHLIKKYFGVVLIGMTLLLAITYLLEYNPLLKEIILIFAAINFTVLLTYKILGRWIIKSFRKKGYNTRMAIVIADKSSSPFIEQLIYSDHWGYIIGGIITDSKTIIDQYQDRFQIISPKAKFAKVIDDDVIDEVFFCKKDYQIRELNKYITKCREIGVIFHMHSDVFNVKGMSPKLSFLDHQFFLSFRQNPENYLALKIKTGIDYILATTILVLTSPIMLVISILILLEDRGPIFFKQTRVGKNGRHFTCLKFRTMVVNAEDLKAQLASQNEQDGPIFKIKNDPRITKIGKFLRKTSLDEFPQFLNVLMGNMSIVGPRPPIPAEVKMYERSLNRRLSIPPGITCIWQISGRNNIPFDRWMEMDMEYIDNWSLKLDFVIMLKTFKIMLTANGQ